MVDAQETVQLTPNTSLDEDLVFSLLGESIRRRLLAALVRKGPQPAIKLPTTNAFQLSNTVKHLGLMRDAGLVTMTNDPTDGRRALYSLSPAVPAIVSESGTVFRFNFPSLVIEVPIVTATKQQWNEDLIFKVLSDPARRKLLLALARGGPQPVVKLSGATGRTLDVTLKRLATMRTAGLVTMSDNTKDGRRNLYSLSPKVPLTTDGSGKVIDFGFCVLRLG